MTDRLPTREEMLANAAAALDKADSALTDALDWLRSDWQPVGSSLTGQQARDRRRMQREIGTAKNAINRAKGRRQG